MNRKVNYSQLLVIAIVVGAIAGIFGFVLGAVFHLDRSLVGAIAIAAVVVLVQPIYNRLKSQGILK